MKKAVGYIRVSTVRQVKEGESLATQREEIENYAKRNLLDFIKIYTDEGLSGGSVKKRPGLKQLLHDAQNKEFDCVLINRLSRLGRNAMELLNNIELLKKVQVNVIFLKENIDDSNSYGKCMLTMLAAMAELEKDVSGEASVENKISRAKQGIPTTGKYPFGRKFNKKLGCWYFDPPEIQEIVEDIANRYLKGEGLRDIADTIPKKYKLTYSNILKVFHNFCGDTWEINFKKENDPIKFEIPRLLAEETINKIHKCIDFNKTYNRSDRNEHTFLLTGFVRCMECNLALTAQTQKSKARNGKFYTYKFYRHRGGTHESCKAMASIRTELIENAVMKVIWQNLSDEDSGANYAWEDNYPDQNKIDKLVSAIEGNKNKLFKVEAESNKLLDLHLAEAFTADAIEQRCKPLLLEISRLKEILGKDEDKLAKLPTREEVKEQERKLKREFSDYYSSKERFESMTFEEKRGLLRRVFDGQDEEGKALGIYVRRTHASTNTPKSEPDKYEYFINARFFAGYIDVKEGASGNDTNTPPSGSNSTKDDIDVTRLNEWKKLKQKNREIVHKTNSSCFHHWQYG